MPEKRTETRGPRQDSGTIRCVGAHSRAPSRFPSIQCARSWSAIYGRSARRRSQESGNYPEHMRGPLTISKIALTHDHRGLW